MKRRIGLWALSGFAIAMFWFLFGFFTWPNYNLGRSVFVAITAPASLLGRSTPLAYHWLILLNAVVYGLAGLIAEAFRWNVARARTS